MEAFNRNRAFIRSITPAATLSKETIEKWYKSERLSWVSQKWDLTDNMVEQILLRSAFFKISQNLIIDNKIITV